MDNGGSHKNKNIKDVILKSNNKLLYSVPYRPKTNAIGSWFSQFKHYFVIENDALTYEQLKKHVKICIKSIPKTSYKNYMNYAYRTQYVRKYTEKQSSRRRVLKKYRV